MTKTVKFSISIAALGIFAWLAFGFFGIQALFYDRVVDEALPAIVLQAATQEDMNTNTSKVLGRGSFQQGDSTYIIAGNAVLSEVDGKRMVSFTNFTVTNGPDLFVYLVKTNSTDNQTVKSTAKAGDFVNIAVLKGNIGNQNYEIPADLNLADYQTVSIWCRRFGRNFGAAYLKSAATSSM